MKTQDINFLNKLQEELNTQTNDGNASPVFWVIRQYEDQITDSDFGEKTLYAHSDGDCSEFKTLEDLRLFLDEELDSIEHCETLDEAFDIILADYNDSGYFYRYDAISVGVIQPDTLFITKKEAQQHIENNRRHYNSTVHTYAMTAWRSRVVEKLWDILRTADFSMLKEEQT
ncbi:hypothetical protein CRJ96_12415 [Listeria monocytogenes]|uniref:hypothetical protein n=1 Tax=Listeria seeligeri TaxID=1640 RepID=UPI0010F0F302|nr:hypothetical protein [Listeria seeligeri]EAD5579963.1 hypothetical protein [Listeria monocytogenes]EAE9243423.1 hypothetical protein [Listeria monocytogenes]EAF1450598.1 hypothetical protein [Listeria monocytogenes]EAF1789129.1 hypothetical protein [Listeria monocytogenes]EAF2924065.1 hypothetical protein [Listeria monocytogenes]